MKPSKYNYIQPYKNGAIFMNGLSEASFWVPEDRVKIYREIIKTPNTYARNFEKFINRLKSQLFVLEDDADENALLKNKYNNLRGNGIFQLMIMPTYACNLRCWYCVQKHENQWLSDSNYDSLRAFINKNITSEISHFSLRWFGGEPLMAFERVRSITKEFREFALSKGITFDCGITTNATLLNSNRIEELRAAGITSYQITIDGDKITHDKVKNLAGKSAYDTVMNHVAEIARHTDCILRFNYSNENLQPESIVNDICAKLPDNVRKNISMDLQPVWQENFTSQDFDKVEVLMDRVKDENIRCTHKTGGLCYVDMKHYHCLFPNGTIGKCENGAEEMQNSPLDMEGNLLSENADISHYHHTLILESEDCGNCKYLPICWGPCSKTRYLQLKNNNKIHCFYPNREIGMGELIRNMYLTSIHSHINNPNINPKNSSL